MSLHAEKSIEGYFYLIEIYLQMWQHFLVVNAIAKWFNIRCANAYPLETTRTLRTSQSILRLARGSVDQTRGV